MNIAIIIVNWNGKDLLKNCLDSLENQTSFDFRIILVDNGSKDGSVLFLKEKYPKIEIIELSENFGFAKANNIGISRAFEDEKVRHILTLNNDTVVDSKFIETILKEIRINSNFGSIQPKIFDSKGEKIDCVGMLISFEMSAQNKGYGEKDLGQFEKKEEIFGSSACASLYSREALESVKLPRGNYFDESYFAYFEDVDLAWRMRLAGFKSYYCPEAKVFHVHSATGVKNSQFKKFHLHRNQYYNIIKNLPFFLMMKAIFFMPIRYLLVLHSMIIGKRSVEKKNQAFGKPRGIVKNIFGDWRDVLENLPQLLKKRKIIQNRKKVENKEVKKWLKQYKADFKKTIYG